MFIINSTKYSLIFSSNSYIKNPYNLRSRQPARTEWYVRAGRHVGQASASKMKFLSDKGNVSI